MVERYSYFMAALIPLCLVILYWSTSANAHDPVEPRSMICFKEFPTDPALFSDDMKPYVSKIIAKHGFEEWKAVVLTNELHHHMGLWSILGAKMGVRARELLNAPFDEVDVSSSAGGQIRMAHSPDRATPARYRRRRPDTGVGRPDRGNQTG
jgi:hypothetical protein